MKNTIDVHMRQKNVFRHWKGVQAGVHLAPMLVPLRGKDVICDKPCVTTSQTCSCCTCLPEAIQKSTTTIVNCAFPIPTGEERYPHSTVFSQPHKIPPCHVQGEATQQTRDASQGMLGFDVVLNSCNRCVPLELYIMGPCSPQSPMLFNYVLC